MTEAAFFEQTPTTRALTRKGQPVTTRFHLDAMPRAPTKTVADPAQPVGSQPPTTQPLQQVKPEHLQHQQLQLQQQLQQQQQQYQLQQHHMQQLQQQAQAQVQAQAQAQAQLHQQPMQYPVSGTIGQSATANNLVSAAVQAANAAATAAGGYAFPRNSPEFACENVGERVKGKRRKYCPHEVTALVLGVQRYADDSCPWSSILRDPHLGHLFHGRSGVDLKDKWRTLIKTRPELAAYTENRKNHRKYRPFTKIEEDALMEGVKKYNGQRNVWSLILVDKDLGPKFNDRSNVQLKDKFRTMRRSGNTSSLVVDHASRRSSAASTPTSAVSAATSATSTATVKASAVSTSSEAKLTATPSPALAAAVSAAVNGTSRMSSSLSSASHQAATLLVQSNVASAMFADPSLYLGGAYVPPTHLSQAMNMPQMTTTQSRQQSVAHAQAQAQAQAQAHAQAQAQAIAQAQARAQQLQQMQQHQLRTQNQVQQNKQQQFQMMGASASAYSSGIPGYQLVGNQLIPNSALYYQVPQSQAQSHQQAQLQQQQYQQQQLQQRQLQQQQQQQLAAAVLAAQNPQASQQQQKPQQTSAAPQSGTTSRV